jgi:RNA polymerase primary sigma factor
MLPTTINSETVYTHYHGHHSILTNDEEHELLVRAKRGDKEAVDELIVSNQRLVQKIARGYMGAFSTSDLDFMDLVQVGNLGLIRAVEKFELKKNNKFGTYATWWVKAFIRRHCLKHSHSFNLSYDDAEKLSKITRQRGELEKTLERDPTVEEISKRTGVDLDSASFFLSIGKSVRLDAPITRDSETERHNFIVGTTAQDIEDTVNQSLAIEAVKKAIGKLPANQQRIIFLHFGLDNNGGRTSAEIARELGISRTAVDKNLKSGLENIRKWLRYISFTL